MRIFLHDYGGYAFTLQLAGALARRGHEVCYAYSITTQYVERCDASKVDTPVIMKGIQLSQPFQKYSFLKRRQAEIEHGRLTAGEIKDFQPDVVISANAPLDAQAAILRAARNVGARFVYWFQDAIGMATRRALHTKLGLIGDTVGRYYQYREKGFARQSDHLVLISDDFQKLMQDWGIEHSLYSVVPNWAPLPEISPGLKENPWAVENNLAGQFCFLYSGILGLKHDPRIFVRLAEHFADCEDARILVVSEGGGADWLKEQREVLELGNLIVMPFQPAQRYEEVLATGDVLISILKEEAGEYSVPSKVLSYLCAARPILLSVPLENAAAKMVVNAEAGKVSAPSNLDGFLRNAEKLFEDQEMRHLLGTNGRLFAENLFDIERIADKFANIL